MCAVMAVNGRYSTVGPSPSTFVLGITDPRVLVQYVEENLTSFAEAGDVRPQDGHIGTPPQVGITLLLQPVTHLPCGIVQLCQPWDAPITGAIHFESPLPTMVKTLISGQPLGISGDSDLNYTGTIMDFL